ncbi:ATP-binding protein [Kitasatospora sp. NPDC048298]|uniref:ATP-binding protein n=1 Tax=Kitasatospora sp. NPDC048298 TaxID=3364049 RepID=UPI00371EFBC6
MSTIASLEFVAERERIGDLRRWARTALPTLGLDGRQQEAVSDDLQLVLSELGTNAVVHGCGGERPDVMLTARLRYDAGVLRVSVTDPGLGRPEYRSAGDEATCGRGLMLVTAVVSGFGVEEFPEGGKEIWAEIGLPEQARPAATVGEQVHPRVAAPRADALVREFRPRPAVGPLPGQPARDRIPA